MCNVFLRIQISCIEIFSIMCYILLCSGDKIHHITRNICVVEIKYIILLEIYV